MMKVLKKIAAWFNSGPEYLVSNYFGGNCAWCNAEYLGKGRGPTRDGYIHRVADCQGTQHL